MEIVNAFATHPGVKAQSNEKPNEDYAHAWNKNGVYYQAVADGNGRTEDINPAAFVINEVQRFIDECSEPNMNAHEIKRMINGAVQCANRVILAYKGAKGDAESKNAFSSLDVTAIFGDSDFISVHVGDTRTYLLRNQKLHQLTIDHTEAQRLCSEGKISKEQIFSHPDRDVLTSALGTINPKIDIREGKVVSGDIIILLTDGAHKVLSQGQIEEIILTAGNCIDTGNGIIKGANMLGGPDNISVCVTYIPKKTMAE